MRLRPGLNVIALGALAGFIAGGLLALLNNTIILPYTDALTQQWLGYLEAEGLYDEGEFNALSQSILVISIALPLALGTTAGVLVSLIYSFLRQRVSGDPVKITMVAIPFLWFVLTVIPALKYPPDAEATFDPAKAPLYYSLLAAYTAVSAGAAVGCIALFSKMQRNSKWFGAGALYLGVIATASFLFPTMPHDDSLFPLQILVPWRAASAEVMTLFWIALGLLSGLLLKYGTGKARRKEAKAE
ncbi:MAG TPA: CbtA family protein [Nitrososphaera sp.]|nr:CbtA family protein [Nitrososphaera sp.]